VGFVVTPGGTDKVLEQAGIPGLALGNQRQQALAITREINATGGLLGRKINPVIHEIGSGEPAAIDQASCDALTQDAKVEFVISILGDTSGGVLASCLAKRGAVLINNNYAVDEQFVRGVRGHLFLPSDWVLDRVMRTQTAALNAQGFFKGSKKVGVLLLDQPPLRRALSNVVIPSLAQVGVKDPEAVAISAQNYFTNAQSVVLKFRAAGVDRVISIATSPLFLMNAAENQGYRPRYGLYSLYGPGILLQTAAPRNQLIGSVGFGYSPSYDVDKAHNPGPVSARESRCEKIMREAGVNMDEPVTRALVLWFCDAGWFLQAAVQQSGEVSVRGLQAGAQALRSYASPVTWKVDLSSGRPDGVAAYRDFAYVESCSCFQYTSGLKPAAS
jgi:ABC-type branched-subunit amino acid transport system substrate-binding protein